MTLLFETNRFRVQVVGKSAWVEIREGSRWVFRSQHNLPVNLSITRGRNSNTVLRAALKHYEYVRHGDPALHEALTGNSARHRPGVPGVCTAESGSGGQPNAIAPAECSCAAPLPRERAPLRPPSSRIEGGLPQRV